MNLAVAQYQAGDPAAAEATVLKSLEYDPDQGTARQLFLKFDARSEPRTSADHLLARCLVSLGPEERARIWPLACFSNGAFTLTK